MYKPTLPHNSYIINILPNTFTTASLHKKQPILIIDANIGNVQYIYDARHYNYHASYTAPTHQPTIQLVHTCPTMKGSIASVLSSTS